MALLCAILLFANNPCPSPQALAHAVSVDAGEEVPHSAPHAAGHTDPSDHHDGSDFGTRVGPGAGTAASTPGAQARCPRPGVGCPCDGCRDFVAAHFIAVPVSIDIRLGLLSREAPQPRYPEAHTHLLDPPPLPPPRSA